MDRRKALAAALAVGIAAGPTTIADLTVGSLVSPAAAENGHRAHGRGGSRGDVVANPRTITLYGIVTGTPTSTSLQITRTGHEHNSCLTTTKVETITLDGNTTFSTQSKPSAAFTDLTSGDTVAVTLTVPHGTAPLSVAATSVADLGTPAPVTCTVRGTATSGVNGTSFTVAIAGGTRHGHHSYSNGRRHRRGGGASSISTSALTVNIDANTVFVDPGNPSASIGNLAMGDRLIIVWSAPPGTALTNMPPAAKVTDLGPARPVRYRAEGVAAGTPTTTISLTVHHLHPNPAPAVPHGTNLSVLFNGSTAFIDPGNPSATIADIAQGDRLIVVWKAAAGTPAVSLPAASRIIDLGH